MYKSYAKTKGRDAKQSGEGEYLESFKRHLYQVPLFKKGEGIKGPLHGSTNFFEGNFVAKFINVNFHTLTTSMFCHDESTKYAKMIQFI